MFNNWVEYFVNKNKYLDLTNIKFKHGIIIMCLDLFNIYSPKNILIWSFKTSRVQSNSKIHNDEVGL